MDIDKEAERYMVLCNLIETIWAQRKSKTYYDVDTDNLIPFTSDSARKVARFIHSLYEFDLSELEFAETKLKDIETIVRY